MDPMETRVERELEKKKKKTLDNFSPTHPSPFNNDWSFRYTRI